MSEVNDNLLHRFSNDFSIFITAVEAIRESRDQPETIKQITDEILLNKEKYMDTFQRIKKQIRANAN